MATQLVLESELSFPYEDKHILVFDKPAGIPTQGQSENYWWDAQGLVRIMRGEGWSPVFRLNHAVSGLLPFGKDLPIIADLQKQWVKKKIRTTYLAVVEGEFNPKNSNIFHFFETVNYADRLASIIEIYTSNRDHQVRTHLAHLGHPIIGDTWFNQNLDATSRLLLHASEIRFTHPVTKKELTATALMPEDYILPSVR